MRDFEDIDDDFKGKLKRHEKRRLTLFKIIGEQHKNGFRQSFRMQRFNDYGGARWDKPDRTDSNSAFPPPTRSHLTRNTLIGKAGAGGSGLQDSFHVKVSRNEIAIQNVKDYAEIQNEGGTIKIPITNKTRKFAWAMYYKAKKRGAKNAESWKYFALTPKKSTTVKIPKRQYMGHSRKIDDEVAKDIDREMDKIF